MKTRILKLLLPLLAALITGPAVAEWDLAGNVDLAARVFTDDARWPGQDDSTLQLSIAGSAEARWRGDDARASIIPYLRFDAIDDVNLVLVPVARVTKSTCNKNKLLSSFPVHFIL